MPQLVKTYIRQVITGFGLAAIFVAMLLWFNVKGLYDLISGSSDGMLALFLLWFMNGLVFGGIQFAIWVMAQAEPKDGPGGGMRLRRALQPVKVRISSK